MKENVSGCFFLNTVYNAHVVTYEITIIIKPLFED